MLMDQSSISIKFNSIKKVRRSIHSYNYELTIHIYLFILEIIYSNLYIKPSKPIF